MEANFTRALRSNKQLAEEVIMPAKKNASKHSIDENCENRVVKRLRGVFEIRKGGKSYLIENSMQIIEVKAEENAKGLPKDVSKRTADGNLENGGKKRILGDITNRTKNTSGKTIPKKETKSKASENSVSSVAEKVSYGKSLRSQTSKSSSSSEESVMYVTALEENDSVLETSSLMVPEDTQIEINEIETAPAIPKGIDDFDASCLDDPNNAAAYAYEIFKYYKKREQKFQIKKYLHKQPEITSSMRAILVDWLVEVQESFELNHETLYLSVKVVDMYLMQEIVSKAKLQLIGAVAMFIASKFDERNPPLVDDFLYICDDSYERKEFLETETKILLAIRFNLGIPLSYRFLRRYGRCARVSMEMLTLARYILEMSLMDYEVVDILDSKIAAAALLLAHKMKHSAWSPTLEFYSGYKESELIELAMRLNRNISARSVRQLMTIRTKYSHDVFFCVANIEPLLTTNLGSSDMKTVTSLN